MVKVKALNENIGGKGNKIGDTIEVSQDVLKMLLDNKIVAELPKEKKAPEKPKQEKKKEDKTEGGE